MLTRHGKPVAVILDSESYSHLQSQQGSFGRLYQRFMQDWTAEDPTKPDTAALAEDSKLSKVSPPATDVDQDDPFSGIRSVD